MLSTADFVATLQRLQLLSPEQLGEVTRLAPGPAAEPRELAGRLIQKGWLTAYQVNRLLQGRADELVLGHYLILDRLGEGGMGTVYKARHAKLGRIAALKVIRPERLESADAVRRFHREVRAAAQLTHPNVVRAFDADEVAGHHFLVLEYVDGVDLAQLVKQQGPLPVRQACEYVRQAAQGLQHAYERGLVHRDIKPHNLLLSSDGSTLKVLDMGLARLAQTGDMEATEAGGTMTHDGAMMGTPDYVAPEQAECAHEADIRADLYSLGCTLYFLLTGQVPFPGGSLMQKLLRHKERDPVAVEQLRPEVPAPVAAVVRRLLRKLPAERYQTPAELAHALANLTGLPVSTAAAEAPPLAQPIAVPGESMDATVNTGSTDHGAFDLPPSVLIDRDSASSIIRRRPHGEPNRPGQRRPRALWLGAAAGAGALIALAVLIFRPRPAPETIKPEPDAKKSSPTRPTPARGPADDAWCRSVAALAPAEQVQAVVRKLRELNPAFDGKTEHKVENDAVTELRLSTDAAADISPVRALTRLRSLECRGGTDLGLLVDLTPLQDLRLTALDCGSNPVRNLTPLKGMPLVSLTCDRTLVSDLAPVQGAPLARLIVGRSMVTTLALLQGVALRELDCHNTKVADLAPLEGMRLSTLNCAGTEVLELTPLKGMPLLELTCDIPRGADVAILQSLPLRKLTCDFSPWRDIGLRSLKTLEQINGQSVAAFWARVDQQQAQFKEWTAGVAQLPVAKQGPEVAAELRRRNPAYDGKIEPLLEKGVVTGLRFSADEVTDLAPVRALPGLRKLFCAGSAAGKGKLCDLAPLHGLSLVELSCANTNVSDLTPLQGSGLLTLDCHGSRVRDLATLNGLPLTTLDCSSSRVLDLAPLASLPLADLNCSNNPALADLAPLARLQLHRLACAGTAVADLTPVRGMALAILDCERARVTDLTPLAGRPLEKIRCEFHRWRDTPVLRSLTILNQINGKAADNFWKAQAEFDAWCNVVRGLAPAEQVRRVTSRLKEHNPGFDGSVNPTIENNAVTALFLTADGVTDLSPVRALPALRRLTCSGSDPVSAKLSDLWPLNGLPLTHLHIEATKVSDLTPLAGTPLETLHVGKSPVSDLSPLKGLPLKELDCSATRVADLAPLRGMSLTSLRCKDSPLPHLGALEKMPLQELVCDFRPWRDAGVLRSLKNLVRINGQAAAAFLQKLDDDESAFAAWSASLRALDAKEQARAVGAELKRRNPGFDGEVKPKIDKGVLVGLEFATTAVADISPVRALPALAHLECRGPSSWGKLADLWALKGLKLKSLTCELNPIADLEPLRGMLLTELRCGSTRVADLGPLSGMPLTILTCASTPVRDVAPLRGMPLATLVIDKTRVSDLAPLKESRLKELSCRDTLVADLSPLKGRPLFAVNAGGTPIADLAPLRGMKLTFLNCERTRVADLAPLRSMPLASLNCERTRVAGLEPLRGLPLKELRCANTLIENLAPLTGMPLGYLTCHQTYVTDLAPLKDLPLTTLYSSRLRLRDLAPLKGLKLTQFACDYTLVEDLSPLQGMPLTSFFCESSLVTSLAPLQQMPLKEVRCDLRAERDVAVLRSIPTLQKLNNQPAAQALGAIGKSAPAH